jgi:peptidylprolyl isomerase
MRTKPVVMSRDRFKELRKIKEPTVKIETITEGNGPYPTEGQTVVVHYTGTLLDGTKFDSSRDKDKPFEFQLGAGQVIAGWDVGFETIKVGGRAKLTIPPALGYRGRNMGKIPPHSTLIFDVELLEVK